jgi:streptogramin lyase
VSLPAKIGTPATNKEVAYIPAGQQGPSGPHQIGLGLGSVWVGVPNTGQVFRIDPLTNEILATINVPSVANPCSGFAFTEQAVWTPSCHEDQTLIRIDPVANKVVAITELEGYGEAPFIIDGAPWLIVESAIGGPGRLVRIDPTTNKIDRELSLGDTFTGAEADQVEAAGSVWVTDSANSQVIICTADLAMQ